MKKNYKKKIIITKQQIQEICSTFNINRNELAYVK